MPLSRLRIVLLVLIAVVAARSASAEDTVVKSPNEQVQFRLTQQDGQLKFSVTARGKTIIESSVMQMLLDGVDLSRGAEIGKSEATSVNERYPWRGVHSEATNHYNGVTIAMRHASDNQAYSLEIRAFDD